MEEQKKNAEKAILQYDEKIKLDPTNGSLYYSRGNSKFAAYDSEGAIEDYSRAIELDPKLGEAYHNRGLSHWEAGRYRKGMEDINKAIEIDPESLSSKNVKEGFIKDLIEIAEKK